MSAPVVLVPGNPMPDGGEARWLRASDSARLRVLTWPAPSASRARGTVFVFGGRTEFAEKYFEVVGELRSRGYAVVTMDWRGQGLSDRLLADWRKGHIDDFWTFERDLARLMIEVAPAFPKPWVALAHSMGGQILLRAAHDHAEWFSAIALSAPMLGLKLGRPALAFTVRALISGLHATGFDERYVPGGSSKTADETPFEENILTHDAERYALLQSLVRAEPKLGLGSATVGWLHAAFRSIGETSRPGYLRAIETPMLICEAAEDALVSSSSLHHAAAMLGNAEHLIVPNARHEILIERDSARAIFWQGFDRLTAKMLGTE
ncbi:MAG: alpha/beta hydrolase [Alphaproteobacteria bacterium HGW-Alphaproteobacteria-12]|nr:MAG: alpha/beta hydrolase [Alphaproteobacteria bacterium HGW-Alphaproteobacteria-12]